MRWGGESQLLPYFATIFGSTTQNGQRLTSSGKYPAGVVSVTWSVAGFRALMPVAAFAFPEETAVAPAMPLRKNR